MEPVPTNLVSNTKLLLQQHTNDSHFFQQAYSQIGHLTYNEEESLANKVGPLSQAQVYQLRSQILAYKHLIRNVPVPTALAQSGINSNLWFNEREKLAQRAVAFYRDKIEKELQLKNMITGNVRPPRDDAREQEEQVRYMIEKRRNEIDKLLGKEDLGETSRLKLEIESRFLSQKVRDIYHRVLNRVVQGFEQDRKAVRLFQNQLLDRDFYRRQKLQRNRETGNRVEKLENQMKSDYQKRKKRKHKEMLQMMRVHKQQFLEFHRKREKQRKKVVNQARDIYEKKKKKLDDVETEQIKTRIKLIKENDMGKYIEQLKKAKNTRINQLFSQTNKFLKELGAKVLLQKGTQQDENDGDNDMRENEEEQDIGSAFMNANSVYYNITHTVKEEISKQPSLLSGGELKNYQLQGLQWLVSLYNNKLNGILADEMGLGKTIQTISLLTYLIQFKKNYGPFLIVVPLSTISNWMNQFQKWAPTIKKVIYRGNPSGRAEVLKQMKNTKWNVCLTTYDFILKDRQKLNKYNWKYIVIDEGHKMKNAKSKFAGVLGTQYQSDHRLLLTGTPLQNNLTELWALLNFLLPKIFSSCDDFEKWFSIALVKKTGGEAITLSEEERLLIINRLHQVLRPFLLRRVKKQVASQLPDKKQFVIKIELSAWQKLIYKSLKDKNSIFIENEPGKVNSTALNNLMMQQRKCCNHPYMFLKNYDDLCYTDWIYRSSGKFELLDRILPKLRQFKHRVLIFTQMTHLMDIMQIYFSYRNIKHLRLDGGTKDRGQMTDKFNEQNSEFDVFLLSTRAGGLGLNLQAADTVIIFDSDWNPQMDLQAQDRAHRIGQKREVIVLRFICVNTIEEDIYSRASDKKEMDDIIIQGGLYNLNSSQIERRRKIEDVLKKTGETSSKKDEIPNDEMINKFLSRNEQEFERFTKMDEERYMNESNAFSKGQENEDEDSSPANYRLMTEEEIPKWFTEASNKSEIKKQYGRGNRVRKQVNYRDDLTDQQFNNLCLQNGISEENESSLVPVPKEKKNRKGRKTEHNNESKTEKQDDQQYEALQ